MKVVLYTRVSTDKQAEQGLGLDIQRRALRTWAREGGHRIIAERSDDGVSGSSGLEARPGLAAAFVDMDGRRADALVIYRLDRLARKLANQETWIEQIERGSGQVISITEPDHGEDEMRVLIRQILGAVAQWERAVIRKRLAAGRAEKARQGGYAYGSPPFGWSAKDRELVRNQAERAIANRMRSMRANGASLRQIADTLNAERVPAKRGGRWHPETIKQALSR